MQSKRQCRTIPLSKQPLTLVLIQLRFSSLLNISDYIPAIQDQLRKNGFPLVYHKNIAKLEASPSGLEQVAVSQWKFETPERHTSVILDQDQILLQTTTYESFEKFIELYFSILKPVLDITEHGTHGIAGRLGLRYVDQVTRQSHDDDIDSYLRPSMQGMSSPYFKNKKKRYTHIEVADTELRNGQKGMLSIRILRNAEQLDLPSDLYSEAPVRLRIIDVNDDFALIDMDHGCENPFPSNCIGIPIDQLEDIYFALHDTIDEVFFQSVITEEGVKKWM
ncbi:MAG TPA: TIGR04255 family protein [Rectinema sp.]|nr:TIGR04255 family protein [Rectinema sp.]